MNALPVSVFHGCLQCVLGLFLWPMLLLRIQMSKKYLTPCEKSCIFPVRPNKKRVERNHMPKENILKVGDSNKLYRSITFTYLHITLSCVITGAKVFFGSTDFITFEYMYNNFFNSDFAF